MNQTIFSAGTHIKIPKYLDESEKNYIKRSDFIVRLTRLLQFIENHLDRTKKYRLLEVGCMNGLLARFLKANGHAHIIYHGVDIDQASLKKAMTLGLDCKECDLNVDTIPFNSLTFDCVIAFEVMEHIPFYHHLFSEMSRVMKKKGLLFVTTPNITNLGNRLRFLKGHDIHRIYTRGQNDIHYRMFNENSVKNLMGMHHFKCIKTSVLTSKKSRYTNLIKNIFPSLSDIIFCVGEKSA